jgi:hypothetical protein
LHGVHPAKAVHVARPHSSFYMTPADPLLSTSHSTATLRGWRLGALVLAVLVVHVLLLARWLHHSAHTPDVTAATAPTPPAADRNLATVHLAPPQPASQTAAEPAKAETTLAHPTRTTGPAAHTPPAPRAQASDAKQKSPPAHDLNTSVAINSKTGPTTSSAPPEASTLVGNPALPPDVSTAAPNPAGTAPIAATQPQSKATAERADATTPGLAASVPGKLRLPPSMTLSYEVVASRKGVSLPASSTLRYTQDGGAYDARMEIKAMFVGSRTQTSKGTVDPVAGLQPLRFGDKTKSELAAHFDRSRQPPAVRFSANTPDAALQPYTQDRLSVLFQLAAMLAGDPKRLGPGSIIAIHTAGPRDADMWQFKVAPADELSLPAGKLTAIHLVRTPMHAYDNQVEVWLAPSLGHMPVRVLWTQANGDVVDQRLTGHEP